MSESNPRLDPDSAPKANFMGVFTVGGRVMSSDEFWFKERIIFLPREVDDQSAHDIAQRILALGMADPNKEITLYINSPGGSVVAGLDILAAMDAVPCDIRTICMGQAASMASIILAHGTKGKRMIAPNSRVLIHQVRSGGTAGVITQQEISLAESARLNLQLAMYLAADTGQSVEDVLADFKDDTWLNAEQAIEYGAADVQTEIKRRGVSKVGVNPPSERAAQILEQRRAAKRRAARSAAAKERAAARAAKKPGPELAA